MKKILLLFVGIALSFGLYAQEQIFADDFQDNDISDWLTYTPSYDTVAYKWHLSDYQGDYYLSASAYDGVTHSSEQWIISPVIDASNYTNVSISFDNRQRYTIYDDLRLFVSTDFAGDSVSFKAATWTEVTGLTLDSDPSDYDWATTSNLNLGVDGKSTVYIAFKYLSDYPSNTGGNWTINNIVITGTPAATGINSVAEPIFSIYPNPATDMIYLNVENSNNNVKIINNLGQVVLSLNNVDNGINVSNLEKGVYSVVIENENGTVVKRFVKR